MTLGIGWLLTHQRDERVTIHSTKEPQELLDEISKMVVPKPSVLHDVVGYPVRFDGPQEERHSDFVDDWRVRGETAIRSRGLYGLVKGSHFWLEVATGYDARRDLIPRLTGDVSAQDGGSIITFRLRMMQRNRAVGYLGALGFSVLLFFVGLSLLIGALLIGLLVLAIAMLFVMVLLWHVNGLATLAVQLAERLKAELADL